MAPASRPPPWRRCLLLCISAFSQLAASGKVRSGSKVSLQAHTGAFIDVREGIVEARWTTHKYLQELIIDCTHDDFVRSGDEVFLRTASGMYLRVDGEAVTAHWGAPGKSHVFIIETLVDHGIIDNGETVYFRAHTGMYVDVDGYKVQARWPDQGAWQQFAMHDMALEGGTMDLFHGALDVIGTGCGFVNLEGRMLMPVCDKDMETDCTSRNELAKACPAVCPFLAPHPQLSCVFKCTVAADCSKANPETAYANNITKKCEPCNVVGCRRCTSPQACAECFDNFWPEFGGRACMYVWDQRAQHGAHAIAALIMALLIIGSVVLVIADHCACCGTCLPKELPDDGADAEFLFSDDDDLLEGHLREPPCLEESAISKAIRLGKRHRGRCKIKDLDVPSWKSHALHEDQETQPLSSMAQETADRLPIWLNFRARFLTGVGLPLFHQWYCFLFLYSLLMAAGTFWVYRYSELGGVIQETGMHHAMSNGLSSGQEEDKMAICGLRARNSDQLGESVRAFAQRAAIVYFLLWVLGFGLSVAHAVRQKRVASEFFSRHPCLAEFALNVEGFPADAADEVKIRNYLRDAFRISNLEVSVCYDYRNQHRRVHELLDRLVVHADVRMGTYDASMAVDARGRRRTGLSSEERKEVRSWFDPQRPGGVRNSGQVFAIFPHVYDLQLCRRKFEAATRDQRPPPPPTSPHDDTPRWLPRDARPLIWVGSDGKMHDLVIRDVICEPPDVLWENLGTECPRLVLGHIFAGFAILTSFATMAAGIFVPLAFYVISYMLEAGSLPTGVMMSVLGTLVMAANWVMCFVHSKASAFVGFVRRDREGLLLFKVFACLCLINFLFNVSIALVPESHAQAWEYIFHPLGRGLVTMQGIAFQARVSAHIFHVLVPGGLFIGYLIWPLQGFLWPFAASMAWLRCRHRRSRFVPAREAELALEPLVISIPHDYMGHIVQPTACTLVLFFASDVAWQTFLCLVCWSLFMMPFMRYLHTRQVRRFFFTTNRLDVDALFIWSLPLSLVLAASFFWAAQLRGWPLPFVFVVWAAGIAIYIFVIAHCVRPLVSPKSMGNCHRPSYDDTRAMRRYDWHNCNPIKVLLSNCDAKDVIVPFSVGKEYLQDLTFAQPRRKPTGGFSSVSKCRSDDADAMTEDTWRHIPTFPEVEALIDGPLDALSALNARVRRHTAASKDFTESPEPHPRQDSWPDRSEGIEFSLLPDGEDTAQPL